MKMSFKKKLTKKAFNKSQSSIKSSLKKGLPPGSLIYLGSERDQVPTYHLMRYNAVAVHEQQISYDELTESHVNVDGYSNWLQLEGIHDAAYVGKIGDLFHFDSLILEDILNTAHRPSFDELENNLFLSMKLFFYQKETAELSTEQFSMILGSNHVITFHEKNTLFFNAIINRIKTAGGRIRLKESDYLFYCLIDLIVDSYYEILEQIEETLEQIEDEVNIDASHEKSVYLQNHLKILLKMRRLIFPLRDALNQIVHNDINLVQSNNEKYFRDVQEHTSHVVENIENLIDNCESIKQLYVSNINLKMNKVIQILTIYTLIFTPLTFIAGLYGMNFDNMPELRYQYGYFVVVGVMVLISASMLIYFKRKRWI